MKNYVNHELEIMVFVEDDVFTTGRIWTSGIDNTPDDTGSSDA